jgi:glutathione-regulated potassium-efflux system ancillary protein KefC
MIATAILMASAALAVAVAKRLALGSTVALLAVGMALGPHSPHPLLAEHVDELHAVGEIGVALLLFVMGLDTRPRRLWRMRGLVVGLGSLQYVLSAAAIAGFLTLFTHTHWMVHLVGGLGLAMSSGAIALSALDDHADHTSEQSRATIAVQILQGVVTVVVLSLIPILGASTLHAGAPKLLRALEVVGAVAGVWVAGRFLVPRALALTARNLGSAGFGLTVIAAVFAAAGLLDRLGVSMALGAFLMGMALSGSVFVEQVKAAVAPAKGLLLGLFFITVGMAIEWREVAAFGPLFVAVLPGLLAIKVAVVFGLGRLFGLDRRPALLTGLLLMPFDEVGYVIFNSANANHLIEGRAYALYLSYISASFILSPLLINLGYRLTGSWDRSGSGLRPAPFRGSTAGQVVVAGYSSWGRGICQMLEAAGVPYIAFDIDLERLRVGEKSRHNVHYGDVTDPTMMGAVAIASARAVVVTTSTFDDSKRMIDNLRRFYPSVPVLAAVQLLVQRDELRRMGAEQVVALWPESTLSFGRSVLLAVGVPGPQADAVVAELKADDYRALLNTGPTAAEPAAVPAPSGGNGTPRPTA